MRLIAPVLASVLIAALSAPGVAQSLEVRAGSPVTIERLAFDAKVEEGVALVEIDETFRNSTDAQQEGVWKFRLPVDAVVSSFSMWMNGKEKTGRVLEAGHARRVYDSIVRKRKDPGLVEQTGWRDFQVSVFPIPARDTVRIRLRYAYVLPDDLGLETLELPLPVGCGAVGDLRVHAAFGAARGLATLDCPSHRDAKLACEAGRGEASWSGDGAEPKGPFVVRVVPKRDGFDVAVLAHRVKPSADGGPEEGFFVARVVPRLAAPPEIPRDVVFVFDRSGSMEGTNAVGVSKIEAARGALLSGLGTLKPGDRFDVISFSTDVAPLTPGLVPVTEANLEAARRAARALVATGGTNISGALDAALALRSSDATRLFSVVFLTDGDPTVGETQPDRILAAWHAKSAGAVRLFAFGVGPDVKDFLLTKLASEGRGTATYLRDATDTEVQVSALTASIRTPLLVDPSVSVEGTGVELSDVEPRRLPDVYQGRGLVVVGRYRGSGKATLRLTGRSGADTVDLAVPVDFSAALDRPHVAQIFAKLRIERLLDDLRGAGANAEIKAEIVRLGLRHQVVSPYTSFLVVEDGVSIDDPSGTARVPDEPNEPSSGGGGAPSTGGGGHSRGAFGKAPSPRPPDSQEPSDPPSPDAVRPETREPSDPPPPPEGGGPSTPGGPDTGGADAGGPSAGAGGRSPGGKARIGFEDWTYWWEYSWDDLLAPARARPVPATSETLRALRALARNADESFHIRSRALVALGAMNDADIVPDLLRIATDASDAEHRAVVERSVLALGLLVPRPPEVRALLLRTLRDKGRHRGFVRPFAASALGLRRDGGALDAETTHALFSVVEDAEEIDSNVRAACLLAIGQIGDASAVSRLLAVLDTRGDQDGRGREHAYVIDALGRIGRTGTTESGHATAVVDALLRRLAKDWTDRTEARSAVGALPRIAVNALPGVQRRIVDALVLAMNGHEDATVNGWSTLALGRIAGDVSTDSTARAKAIDALTWRLGKAKPERGVAYAALGLGLALRSDPCGLPSKSTETLRDLLRAALADAVDSRIRGALALALGLAGDAASSPTLAKRALDAGEHPESRAFALLAGAMVRGPGAPDAVRRALATEGPSLLTIEAAAALGGSDTAAALVAALSDHDISSQQLRAIVRAVGASGDASTVEALRALTVDALKEHPDLTRSYAALAIGRLCGDFGPLDRLTEGINFRAYVPSIWDVMLGP